MGPPPHHRRSKDWPAPGRVSSQARAAVPTWRNLPPPGWVPPRRCATTKTACHHPFAAAPCPKGGHPNGGALPWQNAYPWISVGQERFRHRQHPARNAKARPASPVPTSRLRSIPQVRHRLAALARSGRGEGLDLRFVGTVVRQRGPAGHEPRRFCRRLRLLSWMGHHEQDNEQVFPRSV
jgi:hypothetical protein